MLILLSAEGCGGGGEVEARKVVGRAHLVWPYWLPHMRNHYEVW